MNEKIPALRKKEIAARLSTLAQAAPETAPACELTAASLRSNSDIVIRNEAAAAVDALASARPDMPGWGWIRSILGL